MEQDAEFEKVVDLYYAPLYRFALSLVRQESDASDLVQQTFYIWAEKGTQLKDRTKAKSWLFTTLHREFLHKSRRIIKFPQVDLEGAENELPTIIERGAQSTDGKIVLEKLQEVDEAFRPAISLFYLEDYSYPEIAEVLQVPLGTVKSRISRGLGQLQKLMREGEVGREQLR